MASFLNDTDLPIVAEAARAINDLPLETATPNLAELLEKKPAESAAQTFLSTMPDSLLRRIINANFRLGDVVHLQRVLSLAQGSLCSFAVRPGSSPGPDRLKVQPPKRDRVTGYWRPAVRLAIPRSLRQLPRSGEAIAVSIDTGYFAESACGFN